MNGKKPTREQRKIIQAAGLDTWKTLVQKDGKDYMQVINVETGKVDQIRK